MWPVNNSHSTLGALSAWPGASRSGAVHGTTPFPLSTSGRPNYVAVRRSASLELIDRLTPSMHVFYL
jgi:hypothetical protein